VLPERPAIAPTPDFPADSGPDQGLGDFAPHLSREAFLTGHLRCCLYARLLAKRGLEDGRSAEDAISDILLKLFQRGYVAPWTSSVDMFRALRPKIRREIWRAWRFAKVRRRPFAAFDGRAEEDQTPAR
jgi:hypothetical protein